MSSQVRGAAGACLGDDTIAAMIEGALADDHARRARDHIAGCADCRRMVSAAIDAHAPVPAAGASATAPGGRADHARLPGDGIAPGTVISGRYRVERELGEGGMGRVVVARQLGLERLVAIKILRAELARDRLAIDRFGREARLVASLVSDHVVRVHDSGALATGAPYLVMELLDGDDLATVVARGPVAIEQATAWIVAACDALGEAHALGIIHRDLKPSNLFVTRLGRLKVLDFGLAKLAVPCGGPTERLAMTGAGVMLGTPRYMAPEQITGARDVDARADIWSLGATLYHLVTGRPPFAEPTLDAIVASILGGHLPPVAGIPPSLAGVIARALSFDRAARFATVGELAAALRGPAPARRPAATRIAIVAVAVAVAAIGIGAAQRDRSAPAAPAAAAASAPAPEAEPSTIIGSTTPGPTITGSTTTGPTIIGSTRPGVTIVGSAARDDARPRPTGSDRGSATGGGGVLGNLDEARLRRRLTRLGWTINEVTRDRFPGCQHTRLQVEKLDRGARTSADVWLLACDSRAIAASEGARLRRGFSGAWTVDDGTVVVMVGTGSTERASKQLFDQLVVP